jgi:hypothetical protein
MPYDSFQWQDDARCADGPDPEIFFPPRDRELYKLIAAQAKNYCSGPSGNNPCPVRAECLWSAVKNYETGEDEKHGIWGGLSHRERNAMIRKWQKLYKNQMTLKEYVFKTYKKEPYNASSKNHTTEIPGR